MAGQYTAEPVETAKTKKTPKAMVLYESTPEHPAQVETYHEDVPIGKWTSTHISGAIPMSHREVLLERLSQITEATQKAREQANATDVEDVHIGGDILSYLFAPITVEEAV